MCNLYSLTKGQAAIRDLFRARHDRTGMGKPPMLQQREGPDQGYGVIQPLYQAARVRTGRPNLIDVINVQPRHRTFKVGKAFNVARTGKIHRFPAPVHS
jgi:hypothetical protein